MSCLYYIMALSLL